MSLLYFFYLIKFLYILLYLHLFFRLSKIYCNYWFYSLYVIINPVTVCFFQLNYLFGNSATRFKSLRNSIIEITSAFQLNYACCLSLSYTILHIKCHGQTSTFLFVFLKQFLHHFFLLSFESKCTNIMVPLLE